jgi:RNA polymerase sigma-70 factor (ECF subfamily)
MSEEDFNRLISEMRPRLFRYCARMTGSTIDGEDVVQEALIRVVAARAAEHNIESPERWIMRVAHNAAIDFLRQRSHREILRSVDVLDMVASRESDAVESGLVVASFRTFMLLPAQQRCAVILKDVLGYAIEEIAIITDANVAACKSALQRGRARLKAFATNSEDIRLPLLSDTERQRLFNYVDHFRSGNFDTIRELLAEEVKLDLVARLKLQGRDKIGQYFARYAEATHWRFAAGSVEGRPAMLVFDANGFLDTPAHFVVLDWDSDRISGIHDFLFATYAREALDWVRLR